MTDSTEKTSDNQGEDWVWQLLVFIVALATTVFLLPLLLSAAVLYVIGVKRLSKMEAAIVAVAGGVAGWLWFSAGTAQYVQWWQHIISTDWGAIGTAFPWQLLLPAGLVIAGVFRVVQDLTVVNTVGVKLGLIDKQSALEELTDFEEIIPEVDTRRQLKDFAPPTESLRVRPEDRTVDEDDEKSRSFPLALGKGGEVVTLSENELGMHGLIFGSTGSGKTEAIKVVAGALLDLGWDGLILDHKEDLSVGGLRDWCEEYTRNHHRPYQEIYLSQDKGETWLNPIGGMSGDEARDTILQANVFPDAFWEAINRNELGQIISLIYDAYRLEPLTVGEPTPLHISEIMRAGANMRKAASRYLAIVAKHELPDKKAQDDANKAHNREEELRKQANHTYQPKLRPVDAVEKGLSKRYPLLFNVSKDEASAAQGFANRLEAVYYTDAGREVLLKSEGQEMFDITKEGLTYVGLNSQGKPDMTKIISASVMRRACVLAGQRILKRSRFKPRRKFIIIDEANVVNRTSLMELLSRARSARITVIAATQGPLDYNMNLDGSAHNGPGFAEIAQNTNVMIVMAQGTPEQAEILANYIGEEEVMEMPNQATVEGDVVNIGGIRRVKRHLVPAQNLRQLSIGEAIVRVGKPESWVKYVHFKMREDKSPHDNQFTNSTQPKSSLFTRFSRHPK